MTSEDRKSFTQSFRETVENPELTDALIEAGDKSIGELVDVLEEVPLLKYLVAAGKTVGAVRDHFFIKRLAAFLADFRSLSAEGRAKVIERLDQEEGYRNRAAEALLIVLDRVESDQKAIWVSRAYRAYAAEQISAADLMRLCNAIERVLTCDVTGIVSVFDGEEDVLSGDLFGQAAVQAGLGYVQSGFGVGGVGPSDTFALFKRYILLQP